MIESLFSSAETKKGRASTLPHFLFAKLYALEPPPCHEQGHDRTADRVEHKRGQNRQLKVDNPKRRANQRNCNPYAQNASQQILQSSLSCFDTILPIN